LISYFTINFSIIFFSFTFLYFSQFFLHFYLTFRSERCLLLTVTLDPESSAALGRTYF